jgi:predicted transcriptional regulator
MPNRTDHKAPDASSADAARLREIGCTLWAPGDRINHMAKSLKVDRRTIQRWAAGEVEPGAEVFAELRNVAADRCREIGAVVK